MCRARTHHPLQRSMLSEISGTPTKYALRQMKPQRSYQSLRKINAQVTEQAGPAAAPQIELES